MRDALNSILAASEPQLAAAKAAPALPAAAQCLAAALEIAAHLGHAGSLHTIGNRFRISPGSEDMSITGRLVIERDVDDDEWIVVRLTDIKKVVTLAADQRVIDSLGDRPLADVLLSLYACRYRIDSAMLLPAEFRAKRLETLAKSYSLDRRTMAILSEWVEKVIPR